MSKKQEDCIIRYVEFKYNGNRQQFDMFMECLIRDYLYSDKLPKNKRGSFIGKVELSEK